MMQASKWIDIQALLDISEMQQLLEGLEGYSLYRTGSVLPKEEVVLSKESYLQTYAGYVGALKQGALPKRPLPFCALSVDPNQFETTEIEGGRVIVRPLYPSVYMQGVKIGYSPVDGKFRPMVFGEENICWGVQFSFPQLFKDPVTKQPVKVRGEGYPNTALFQQIRKWIRAYTLPTPVRIGSVRSNLPIRLGKQCFEWINRHPQLVLKGVTVDAGS